MARHLPALMTLGLAVAASADVVTPSQSLRVEFTLSAPFSLTPDMLVLNLGTVTVLQPYTTRTASLYNGAALMGTATKASFGSVTGPLLLNPANTWRDTASPWNYDNPGVANFAPIRNATIQGRIDWRPTTGSVDVNLAEVSLRLGQAAGATSYFLVSPAPVVTSIHIVNVGCSVDIDGNGAITPSDIAMFIQVWIGSISQGTLAGDFDGNGAVEPSDVSLFVSRWFVALTTGNCGT